MKKRIKYSLITLVLVGILSTAFFVGYLTTINIEDIPSLDDSWETIQNWRVNSGKSAYIKDDTLCNYADKRLHEIQLDFSHDGFESSSEILWNYNFTYVGENLAMGYYDSQELLTGWLDSPAHRENLERDFTHGCLKCYKHYCVHIFGEM